MDCILVPLGGGGLISGIAVAVKQARPEVKIIGVQSSAYPAAVASRMAGGRVVVDPSETIADGIAIRQVGENTYPLIEEYVDDLVVVGEDEIANAVLLLLEREKTVAEGAAATTLAALVNDRVKGVEGRNVVMVLSGGNIDVNLISRIIERGLTVDGRLTTLHVRIKDRPGGLATLSTLLASQGGNVLHLDHRRGGLSVSEVDIVVTLETRGIPHVEAIIHELRRHGYAVTTQ